MEESTKLNQYSALLTLKAVLIGYGTLFVLISTAVYYFNHQGQPFPIVAFTTLNACTATKVEDSSMKNIIITNSLVAAFQAECEQAAALKTQQEAIDKLKTKITENAPVFNTQSK